MNRSLRLFLLSISIAIVMVCGCGKEEAPKAETATPPVKVAAHIDPELTGSVAGVVTFAGKAPAAQVIDMSQDPPCTIGTAPNASEAYLVKNGKLANVFVYVKEGLPRGTFPIPSEPVEIDQKGCRYLPHVAGAMAGQTIRFLNSDPTMHNVHPSGQVNSPWNITQTPKGDPIEKTFVKPELMMKISCNQHPWMRMYLNLVEHPFFAVTDDAGKFEIKGLPAGEYTLGAVHEKMGEKTFKVKVETKKAAAAEVVYASGDVK